MALALTTLRTWPARRLLVALGIAVLAALVTGIPTDLIDTPLFGRPVGVTAWSYPVWVLSSLLLGLVLASGAGIGRPAGVGGALAFFAVGCPVCNKPVLLLLGSSGALQWFAPMQPILGALAILVLAVALLLRLRAQAVCATPS